MTYTPASGGHAANFTGSLDFFKKALAANKEGCLDTKSPEFDSLATYCSTGNCCAPVATIFAPIAGMSPNGCLPRTNNGVEVIDIFSPGKHTLQVFNASGAEIMSESGLGKTKYSMGRIKHGVYFVKVSTGETTTLNKIVRF